MDEKDIAPELLERIRADFLALLGDAQQEADTYTAAAAYAELVGSALADAFRRNLTADILPDGRLYWNIADRVVRPLLELAQGYPDVTVEVVPGLTAALSGGAVLGAPLAHDFCVISLSDRLTPWEVIETRLACAARGDFALALYNPSSKGRPDYLQKAVRILLANGKTPETVCGIVRNIGREGQEKRVLTLAELEKTQVDMFTTVFIGNAATRELAGRMVTPRGYKR